MSHTFTVFFPNHVISRYIIVEFLKYVISRAVTTKHMISWTIVVVNMSFAKTQTNEHLCSPCFFFSMLSQNTYQPPRNTNNNQ